MTTPQNIWTADGYNFGWRASGNFGTSADGYEAYPEATVVTMLAAAGLSVGGVTYAYSATVPIGWVISTSPSPYTLSSGTVTLVMSLGPAPANPSYVVPNVVGLYFYDAQLAILAAGLFIAPPVFVHSTTVVPGIVIGQSVLPSVWTFDNAAVTFDNAAYTFASGLSSQAQILLTVSNGPSTVYITP